MLLLHHHGNREEGGGRGGFRGTLHRRNFPDQTVTARAQSSSRASASCRLQTSLQVLDLIRAGAEGLRNDSETRPGSRVCTKNTFAANQSWMQSSRERDQLFCSGVYFTWCVDGADISLHAQLFGLKQRALLTLSLSERSSVERFTAFNALIFTSTPVFGVVNVRRGGQEVGKLSQGCRVIGSVYFRTF